MTPKFFSKVVVSVVPFAPFDQSSLTSEQKRMFFGEILYSLVEKIEPMFTPKITGMLLELNEDIIHHLVKSPEALKDAVKEAMEVLRDSIPQQMQQLKNEITCKILASMRSKL